MNDTRINGLLGLARRGGRLVFGETAISKGYAGKVKLLIIASDASEKTRANVQTCASSKQIPLITYGNKDSLAAIFNKGQIAVIGISDQHLAAKIKQELEETQHGQ